MINYNDCFIYKHLCHRLFCPCAGMSLEVAHVEVARLSDTQRRTLALPTLQHLLERHFCLRKGRSRPDGPSRPV